MSFERITVQIPGSTGNHEAEALLVPEVRVQGFYSGDEVRLRLPEGITVGERIAIQRNPSSDQIFDVLEEERDLNDRPLWRARKARPPVESKRSNDPFEEANRLQEQHRRMANDQTTRYHKRQDDLLEQATRAIEALDEDALRAIAGLNEFRTQSFHRRIRELAAEAERETASVG